MTLPFLKKKKSIEELEEETERARAENTLADEEVSLAQKREIQAQLKARGLNRNNFSSWQRAWQWLRTH